MIIIVITEKIVKEEMMMKILTWKEKKDIIHIKEMIQLVEMKVMIEAIEKNHILMIIIIIIMI